MADATRSVAGWQVRIERTQQLLAERVRTARSLPERMVGLLGRCSLPSGEGLILPSCRSIHTWGMQFAIDALFVNRHWEVVAIHPAIPPGRMTPIVWRAQSVLELAAGAAEQAQVRVGDRLLLEPSRGPG